ncbi:Fe-S cluster assembly protein SufD [Nakamurella sp. DB0629]|uniref:Fe-S cluster assembly protein SufD n=1 Tax=Nakamurella aerolata TaxID=1656892 RepID=A0A849ABL5_9ACTN|nr:Fe-S cluster assembly protein SufD [Nakamurella aerolata]
MTVTQAPNVSGALETSDRVASHLHPEGSFDVADHPVPSGKEEWWRFTPMRRLRGLQTDAPFAAGGCTVTVQAPAPATVSQVSIDDPVTRESGFAPTERVSARAWNAVDEATLVDIPAEAELDQPIYLRHTGNGSDVATAGHAVIRAGRHSKATVVLEFSGSATVADTVQVIAGDGAQLTVVAMLEWADDAVHHSAQHIKVGRDAKVKHAVLTFGGDLVRVPVSVDYDGPGGDVELLGLYYADEGQYLEHRIFVDHAKPNCKSDALYKGALQGKGARTVWVGDVLIRKAAEGTETYEMNRNLLLTEGARADSVPNLEIETGEIAGAGHASATGRFDDEQLFYLLSRGIPEPVARRLVVRGFFGEILLRLGVPDVVERASAIIERELAVTGN